MRIRSESLDGSSHGSFAICGIPMGRTAAAARPSPRNLCYANFGAYELTLCAPSTIDLPASSSSNPSTSMLALSV